MLLVANHRKGKALLYNQVQRQGEALRRNVKLSDGLVRRGKLCGAMAKKGYAEHSLAVARQSNPMPGNGKDELIKARWGEGCA